MNVGKNLRFTHVDPFEDTESERLQLALASCPQRFTHVDPFEDTESLLDQEHNARYMSFTHVDPFEDTERPRCAHRSA